MITHRLKCWPEYFKSLEDGSKNFELRQDDRSYEIGDRLILEEWNPATKAYTGKKINFNISYVLRDAAHFGLMNGYCILSLSIKK